ncbi:MAG TPA: hypothetical protein V6C72_07500, partial [Chroococcales cyanobacterium]
MKVVELAKVGLVPLMPGVSGVFDSVQMASKRVTANTALFMQFAVSGSIGVLVHHASRSARAGFTTALNLWCVGATFMFYLALRKYLTCMGEHPAGLVIGLTSAYPLVTQAADCAILGDPFHPTMVLACLFILGGCFQLLARDEEHQQISTKILWAAVIATVG